MLVPAIYMIQVKAEWVDDWKARGRRLMHENLEGYDTAYLLDSGFSREWSLYICMHYRYPYKSIDIDIEINSWAFAYLIGVTLSRAMSRVKPCGSVASWQWRHGMWESDSDGLNWRLLVISLSREYLRMIEKRESMGSSYIVPMSDEMSNNNCNEGGREE